MNLASVEGVDRMPDEPLPVSHDEVVPTPPTGPSRWRLPVQVAIAGMQSLAYALVMRIVAEAIPGAMVTIGAVVLLPIAMGAVAGEMGSEDIRRSIPLRSTIALAAAAAFIVILLVSGLDGPLYLMAMAPPILLSAAGGSALTGALIDPITARHQRHLIVAGIALAPAALMAFERTLPAPLSAHTIAVQGSIRAGRPIVWQTLLTIDTIRDAERTSTLIQKIGAPRLMSTRMVGQGRDAVRIVSFEKEIEYQELVTAWHPPALLRFKADVDPDWIPPEAIDPDLRLGSDEFDLVDGSYTIDSLGPRESRLRVVCRYSMRTALSTYLAWWTDLVIADAQESALTIVRQRAERAQRE